MGSMSIWHWIIVLLPILIIYIGVRRYWREQRTAGTITPGLIGWLYVFAVIQWLGLIRGLGEMPRYLNSPEFNLVLPIFPVVAWSELALLIVGAVLAVISTFFMLRKSRRFVPTWTVLYVWIALSPPLNILLVYLIFTFHYSVPNVGQNLDADVRTILIPWIGSLVGGAIWLLYLRRSRRVKLTFVR